jgi:hypothetical protein
LRVVGEALDIDERRQAGGLDMDQAFARLRGYARRPAVS